MGRKSKFFRHSFSAHNDDKILSLMDTRHGMSAVGFYFILLEVYGESFMNDDSASIEQIIHIRRIANACQCRVDLVKNLMLSCREVELISYLWTTSLQDKVKLSIPNFLKYYGSYEKTDTVKSPYKSKENKSKENKSKNKDHLVNIKFEEEIKSIYKMYPRKEGKQIGFRKLRTKIKTQDDVNKFRLATENYIKIIKRDNLDQNYVKHFSSFVNNYEDYLEYQEDDLLTDDQYKEKLAMRIFEGKTSND